MLDNIRFNEISYFKVKPLLKLEITAPSRRSVTTDGESTLRILAGLRKVTMKIQDWIQDSEYSHLSWDTDTLARRWFTWIDNFDYIQFKQYKKQVPSAKVEVSSKEESGIAVPFSPLPCLSLLCSSFLSSCHCCSAPPPPDPRQGPPSCPPSPPLCLLPPLLSSQHPWSCSSPQQHHDTSLFSLLLG